MTVLYPNNGLHQKSVYIAHRTDRNIYPFKPNVITYPYQQDQPISSFFQICKQTEKILIRHVVSDLSLHCLPMSHKENARLMVG